MENIQKDEDILLLIKFLSKALDADFDKRLSEYGLTVTQGRTLFYITRQNCKKNVVHQNDIEKQFNLSKSTVSGLIDRLVKKGLIKRVNDSRYVELVPTEEGISIVSHFHNNRQKVVEKLTKGLSPETVEEMKGNIKLLIKNVKEEDE